jgi:hypothetical protein
MYEAVIARSLTVTVRAQPQIDILRGLRPIAEGKRHV